MTTVAVCGLGSIGSHAARLLLDHRRGIDVVGAATLEPESVGRRLCEVVNSDTRSEVVVSASLEEMLSSDPDIVLLATGSFLREVASQVFECIEAGADVSTVCEELAFPFIRGSEQAGEIDRAAKDRGVTVLSTGVNPGFMFDALLSLATGACWDIGKIQGKRVVDVLGFSQGIHLRLGIGYREDEFEKGHADGSIAGHVGFPESIEMVCERLGLSLDESVEETFVPMVAETPAPTRYGEIEVGYTEGFVQRAIGRVGGSDFVTLELVLHLRPRLAGLLPTDSFSIEGTHPVHLTIDPGMDAILGTSAQLVNSVPAVRNCTPGLKTVKDLPASAAWLGDLSSVVFR